MDDHQFNILMEKLEAIRCCLIDVETALQDLKKVENIPEVITELNPCLVSLEKRLSKLSGPGYQSIPGVPTDRGLE